MPVGVPRVSPYDAAAGKRLALQGPLEDDARNTSGEAASDFDGFLAISGIDREVRAVEQAFDLVVGGLIVPLRACQVVQGGTYRVIAQSSGAGHESYEVDLDPHVRRVDQPLQRDEQGLHRPRVARCNPGDYSHQACVTGLRHERAQWAGLSERRLDMREAVLRGENLVWRREQEAVQLVKLLLARHDHLIRARQRAVIGS